MSLQSKSGLQLWRPIGNYTPMRLVIYENRSISGLDNVWGIWWSNNGNLVGNWQQQANSYCSRILVNNPLIFSDMSGRDRGLKSCVSRENIYSMLKWVCLHINEDLRQRLVLICYYKFVCFLVKCSCCPLYCKLHEGQGTYFRH